MGRTRGFLTVGAVLALLGLGTADAVAATPTRYSLAAAAFR